MHKDRAETPEQKRAVIERLYAGWLARPEMRLGQLLLNATQAHPDIYYIEDEDLARCVEHYNRPPIMPVTPGGKAGA